MFKSYVLGASFPCVGARAAINRGRMEFGSYGSLGNQGDALALCDDLADFAAKYPSPGTDPVSFVAMFEQDVADEATFVQGLWRHLQAMHDIDVVRHPWDPEVSTDPQSKSFSFSVGGRAFFVVGLSPSASRTARRAPFPCLVFNFHDQFESLKASGKFTGMQNAIRTRDVALQGSINPALAMYGDRSEARQYAGDATAADWVCPFKPSVAAHAG